MTDDPTDATPLCFLAGPTASGKTALAVAVARAAGAEVLSMDSMLVYRGLDIGTAKPTLAERGGVPHHLMDLAAPSETFSVQAWLGAARAALADVAARGRRALFVGGTAFYMKAVIHGLFDGPPADPELRAALLREAQGADGRAALHARLRAVDAASAARLHANDLRRVVRALEVFETTGRPLSAWQSQWQRPGRARRIVGLERPAEELEARIPARTRAMLDAGWEDEVRRVRAQGGFGPTASRALGYPEVGRLVDGALDRETCAREIDLRTRQFARRQRTWLRSFEDLVPIRVEGRIEGGTGTRGGLADTVDEVLAAFGWGRAQSF